MVLVKAGTPGMVRKEGGKWRPHKATLDMDFAALETRKHWGGYLIFTQSGWEFMVLERHAGEQPRKKKLAKRRHDGTFNKHALGKNGKGASRRRNMRRRRSG